MRIFALAVGCLLLIGGGALVVLADQERQAAVAQAQEGIDALDDAIIRAQAANVVLFDRLAEVRRALDAQEQELADDTGFVE